MTLATQYQSAKQEIGAIQVSCKFVFDYCCLSTTDDSFRHQQSHKTKYMSLSVADECGEYSLSRGYYDYCLYLDSSKPEYLALSWKEKTDLIMDQVMAEPSAGNYPYTTVCTIGIFISTEYSKRFWILVIGSISE